MAAVSEAFKSLLRRSHGLVIGMVHLQALPGSPKHVFPMSRIVDEALKEVHIYKKNKVDCVLIENMHDRPYLNGSVGPEVVSTMATVCTELKREFPSVPFGVQILAGCNSEALAVAMATGGSFIRAEGFVYSHVADEGWMDSSAGSLLRYRARLGAENIAVLTDIKKKHRYMLVCVCGGG
jgi:membrane complex biogenesis BtpA family protein